MDLPPPSMPIKRLTKRVLPPVPTEPGVVQTTSRQIGSEVTPTTVAAAPAVTASEPIEPIPINTSDSTQAHAIIAASSTAAIVKPAAQPNDQLSPPTTSTTSAAASASSPAKSADGQRHKTHADLPSSIYTLPLWSAAPLGDWQLDVIKGGRELESIPLRGQSHFLLGRHEMCDFILDHPAISRRHAILQFHENGSLWIYDLATQHGTFRNKQQIAPKTFIQLNVGDMLQFAGSSRMYVVEGPDEFRPKEIDREAIQKHNAAMKEQQAAHLQQQAQQIDKPRTEAPTDASWGMGEDAVDSDDEDEGKVMILNDDGTTSTSGGSHGALPTKLTPQQQKWMDKLDAKREKVSNLSTEIETLRGKDIRQGGLTEGQEKQIARNEERIKQLTEECDNLETMIRENVERVTEDRSKNQQAINQRLGIKSKRKDSDSDMDSEDDDFYDRTKSKAHVQQSQTQTSNNAGSILSTLSPIHTLTTPELIQSELKRIEAKRDQLRLTLQEVVISEQKSKRTQSQADSLDSFMSTISTDALATRKTQLKTNLQELQAHYIKLQRLIEQKRGEELTKKYLAGDQDAFKKQPAPTTDSQPMEIDSSRSTSTPTAATRVNGPSAPPSTSTSTFTTVPPTLASGVSSTADTLARLKKKQEAAARRAAEEQAKQDKLDQFKRELDALKPVATITRETVKAFAEETAPKPALDRYALLAQQLEAARSSVHRDYATLPEDDVTRALKAAASRSAASMSVGLTGAEERGGLHVRKRTETEEHEPLAKRVKSTPNEPSGPRMVGPTVPMIDEELEERQHTQSVEWTPPVASTNQDKLRAKFAGRY